jgi:hypothetical protein
MQMLLAAVRKSGEGRYQRFSTSGPRFHIDSTCRGSELPSYVVQYLGKIPIKRLLCFCFIFLAPRILVFSHSLDQRTELPLLD